MSVEKLKCPKSHPVLTFSRLKYSQRDCLQPRGSKEVLCPLPGIWSWPDLCRIFGLCSSLLIFRAKISKIRLFKTRILFYPLFLEEKKGMANLFTFLLENPLRTWAKEEFWFIWSLILYSTVYIWFETGIWNGSWTGTFVPLVLPTSLKHQPVWKFGGNFMRHPVGAAEYEASASIFNDLIVTQTGFQSLIPSMAKTHLIPCSWVPSIGQGCWLEPSRDGLCWNKQMKEQVSLCKGFFIKPFHVYYQPRPGAFMKSGLLKLLQLPLGQAPVDGKECQERQKWTRGVGFGVIIQTWGMRGSALVFGHVPSLTPSLCVPQDAFVAFHNDKSLVKKYLKSLLIGELAPDQPSFETNKKVSALNSSGGNGSGFSTGGEGKQESKQESPLREHAWFCEWAGGGDGPAWTHDCPSITKSTLGSKEWAPEPQILLSSPHWDVSAPEQKQGLLTSRLFWHRAPTDRTSPPTSGAALGFLALPYHIFKVNSALILSLLTEIPFLYPQKSLLEDFRELRCSIEKMGLLRPNYFFFFLIFLHLLVLEAASWLVIWYFGISLVPFLAGMVFFTTAQVNCWQVPNAAEALGSSRWRGLMEWSRPRHCLSLDPIICLKMTSMF